MFTRVEADNYRCLKSLAVDLGPYQVLVGSNASGKSTLLDVIGFFSDLITMGPRAAASERSENFHDLVWGRDGSCFRLAIEAGVPDKRQRFDGSKTFDKIRYEVQVKLESSSDTVSMDEEILTLHGAHGEAMTVLKRMNHRVDYKAESDPFWTEFTLSPAQSGLANLPMDETKFPATTWFKTSLLEGMQMVVLDNEMLRGSSPAGQGKTNLFDGLNLPRRIARLVDSSTEDFAAWIRHVQTALPDIETIKTIFRPEDKHRYLMVRYRNGIEVPAWMLSDGTLRLLALTVLAYGPEAHGLYLIEEPEVGVHPSAFDTLVQSLSSVYDGQIIITTHSPLLVGLSKPENLLCFSKTQEGTRVVKGSEHPLLQSWQSKIEIGDLFASGVLG